MAKTKLLQTTRLQTGMVLADDLKLQNTGEVLVTAGTRITEVMVECILHLPVETECRINACELTPYEPFANKINCPFSAALTLDSDKESGLLAYFDPGRGEVVPLGFLGVVKSNLLQIPSHESIPLWRSLFKQPAAAGTVLSHFCSRGAYPGMEPRYLATLTCQEVVLLPSPDSRKVRDYQAGEKGMRWLVPLMLLALVMLVSALLLARSPGLFFPFQAGPQSTVSATAWESGSYTGEIQNGIPHGVGTITWPDGTTYTGEWREGKMEGGGEITWPSGATYEGDWHQGMMHGTGTLIQPGGEVLQGTWEYGRLQ